MKNNNKLLWISSILAKSLRGAVGTNRASRVVSVCAWFVTNQSALIKTRTTQRVEQASALVTTLPQCIIPRPVDDCPNHIYCAVSRLHGKTGSDQFTWSAYWCGCTIVYYRGSVPRFHLSRPRFVVSCRTSLGLAGTSYWLTISIIFRKIGTANGKKKCNIYVIVYLDICSCGTRCDVKNTPLAFAVHWAKYRR